MQKMLSKKQHSTSIWTYVQHHHTLHHTHGYHCVIKKKKKKWMNDWPATKRNASLCAHCMPSTWWTRCCICSFLRITSTTSTSVTRTMLLRATNIIMKTIYIYIYVLIPLYLVLYLSCLYALARTNANQLPGYHLIEPRKARLTIFSLHHEQAKRLNIFLLFYVLPLLLHASTRLKIQVETDASIGS